MWTPSVKEFPTKQGERIPSQPTDPAPQRPRHAGLLLLPALILGVLAVTFYVHLPVLDAQAICLDDRPCLFGNPTLENPSWRSVGVVFREVFESPYVKGYYEPLTLVSLMLDVAAGGRADNLRPFHVTSLALHLLNVALLIVLLHMLFRRPWLAAGVGLLFGVHPLGVEPVAWVWERKTLLSAFFTLWCLILYLRYVRRPCAGVYLGLAGAFVLSLLAKPTGTPLPALLLLLDYWPLRRLGKQAFVEKVPLFVIAFASSIVTLISTVRNCAVTLPNQNLLLDLPLKICYLIPFYLGKMLWPVHLSSIYAMPEPMALSHPLVLTGAVITLSLLVDLVISLRWTRAPAVGMLFFVVALSPMLGAVQYSWVAASDKYLYIPAIGLLIALTWMLQRLSGEKRGVARLHWRPIAVGAMVAGAAVPLAWGTRQYLDVWQTSARHRLHIVQLAPDSPYAQLGYGCWLAEARQYDEAIKYYTRAMELKPDYVEAYCERGAVLGMHKHYEQAIQDFNKALQLNPGLAEIYRQRGNCHRGLGDLQIAYHDLSVAIHLHPELIAAYGDRGAVNNTVGNFAGALQDYSKVIESDPARMEAYQGRGTAYAGLGDFARAIGDYNRVISAHPNQSEVYNLRGTAYSNQGDFASAIRDFSKTIELNPRLSSAYNNRGTAHSVLGDFAAALEDFNKAIALQPNFANAYSNRGNAYLGMNEAAKAIQEYTKAIELNPNYVDCFYNRGICHQNLGHDEAAVQDFSRTIKLKPNDAEAFRQRAQSYFNLKQYDRAWEDVSHCRQFGGALPSDFMEQLTQASGRSE